MDNSEWQCPQIPLRDCHFDVCMRPSMARHTASSHGDTPILIQTWFSHLNAYASTYAQYPNEYANLAFPSSLAESANPVAVGSPGEHSCFVAVICRSDVAPDSRVAQSVRQGTGERRASSRTVQKLEVFKQPQWIWSSPSGQQLEVFHRRAAPARFAAIPTWRSRWAVGALGARPDAYTLRRIEAALVLHNGL